MILNLLSADQGKDFRKKIGDFKKKWSAIWMVMGWDLIRLLFPDFFVAN